MCIVGVMCVVYRFGDFQLHSAFSVNFSRSCFCRLLHNMVHLQKAQKGLHNERKGGKVRFGNCTKTVKAIQVN